MPDEHKIPEAPVHPSVRYEKSDARIGGIVAFGVALGVALIVVHFALVWVFDEFKTNVRREHPRLPPLAAQERSHLPDDLNKIPAPLLQTSEAGDMQRFLQAEQAQLNSYGWVDPKAGVVRIPIAEAMKLLADPEKAKTHGIKVDSAKKKGGTP